MINPNEMPTMQLFCDPYNLQIRVFLAGVEATDDCPSIKLLVGHGGNIASAHLDIITRQPNGEPIYDGEVDGPMIVTLCTTNLDIDPWVISAAKAAKCAMVHLEYLN